MKLNHIHLRVRDLKGAVAWFETVLQFHPSFLDQRIATFSFDALTLIFDSADDDVVATVGFESDDCDHDFQILVHRGAIPLQPPTNKDWGVRTAYVKGPGELRLEIEGPLAN